MKSVMLSYVEYSNDGDTIQRPVEAIIARGRTPYQEYLFFRSAVVGTCVVLDGDTQSCEIDEGIYHEALVHPAMLLHPNPRRVLIMGGGEGATAREVLRHPSVERVVMVDIDEVFVDLCRRYLSEWNRSAFADTRIEVQHRDINAFLDEAGDRFDVVIGDLVDFADEASPAAALYSGELYAKLRQRLGQEAVVATQAGGLTLSSVERHRRVRTTLASQFREVTSYGLIVPSFHHLWSYVVACDAPLPVDEPPHALFRERGEHRGLEPPQTGLNALAGAFTLPAALQRRILGAAADRAGTP